MRIQSKKNSRYLLFILAALVVTSCRSCTAQHDPTGDWKTFEEERLKAAETPALLNKDGSVPEPVVKESGENEEQTVSAIQKKYQMFCSSCHGVDGAGDGAAAASLNPKPRNFKTWKDASITDEYIVKIIALGGGAVGKSVTMAAWKGALSDAEITEMVQVVRGFAQ